MATQGSPDARIYSSVRPLQIQRSFEGSSETSDVVESVHRELSIEEHSSVIVTSQTSSTGMSSAVQPQTDGGIKIATSPQSVTPGTVVVTPTTPATVVIKSSSTGAATEPPSPLVGGQNVVIIKSSGTQQQTSAVQQSSVVIRSSQQQVIQPSSPSKIIINPAPLVQSRITIGATSAPVAPTVPLQDGVGIEEPPPPNVLAKRSSLTIKAAPPSPSPPVDTAAAAPVVDGAATPVVVANSDHVPPSAGPVPAEQKPKDDQESHPTPTTREDLSEKVRPKKLAGPSFEEILEKFSISSVFYVALAVLLAVVLCILGEGEVPLCWILTAISFFSVASFVALRL